MLLHIGSKRWNFVWPCVRAMVMEHCSFFNVTPQRTMEETDDEAYEPNTIVSPVFLAHDIDFLTTQEAQYQDEGEISHFYVAVDPCGGSFSSDFVVSSLATVSIGQATFTVVLGIDQVSVKSGEECSDLLVNHIKLVRTLKGFEEAKCVVIMMSNFIGWQAQFIHAIRQSGLPNVCFAPQRPVTHSFRKLSVDSMTEIISNRKLLFHKNVISQDARRSRFPINALAFIQQLRDFCEIVKSHRINYSGKTSGPDDLLNIILDGLVEMQAYIKAALESSA